MADRTYAKFTFFKLDPGWQRRDPEARAQDKREFLAACEDFAQDRSIRAYSTVGTRGDVDLLLLTQSPLLDDIHTFHVVLAQSGIARWATIPHSYLAMTKRSPYSDSEARPEICTSGPQVPVRLSARQEAGVVPAGARRAPADHGRPHRDRATLPADRDQHRLLVRARRPGVRRLVRGRRPGQFLDLVQELRGSESSAYTLRDTPIFTCVAMSVGRALDALDGAATSRSEPALAG